MRTSETGMPRFNQLPSQSHDTARKAAGGGLPGTNGGLDPVRADITISSDNEGDIRVELGLVCSGSDLEILRREADEAFRVSNRKRTIELIEEIYDLLDRPETNFTWPRRSDADR